MKRQLTDLEQMRAQELLVQRATEGLEADGAAELEALDSADFDGLDLAAAALAVALIAPEPIPAELAERLLADTLRGPAMARPAAPTSSLSTAPSVPAVAADLPGRPAPVRAAKDPSGAGVRARRWGVAVAGLAAAAAVATVVATRDDGPRRTERAPSVASAASERRGLLSTGHAELRALRGGPDPSGRLVTGDVVWDRTTQRGYLRLSGLATNDPHIARYQLWIFDRTRDDRFPIDGGLFDVVGAGEVVVPIDARIPVVDAADFTITVEAPVGAVVSDRARIAATTTAP